MAKYGIDISVVIEASSEADALEQVEKALLPAEVEIQDGPELIEEEPEGEEE